MRYYPLFLRLIICFIIWVIFYFTERPWVLWLFRFFLEIFFQIVVIFFNATLKFILFSYIQIWNSNSKLTRRLWLNWLRLLNFILEVAIMSLVLVYFLYNRYFILFGFRRNIEIIAWKIVWVLFTANQLELPFLFQGVFVGNN